MPIPKNQSKQKIIQLDIQKLHAIYGDDFIKAIIENKALITQLQIDADVTEVVNELTIEEAIDQYLLSFHFRSLGESSQKTYLSEANSFLRFCDTDENLPDGRKEKILEVLEHPIVLLSYLHKTENVLTRNKKSSFLRSFLNTTCKKEILTSEINLSRVLPIIQNDDNEPKALNQEQAKELLALSRQGNNNFRNHTIIWVLLGSGMRVSEAVNLQIQDIIPETQNLLIIPKKKRHLSNLKEKTKRKIALPALKILIEYVNFTYGHLKDTLDYQEKYIFSKDGGDHPLTIRTVQTIVKDLIDLCKSIPQGEKENFSTHSLRHTFAISLLEAGVDIFTISKLLGHEHVNATEVYLKLFDYHVQEAIEKTPFAKIKLSGNVWSE